MPTLRSVAVALLSSVTLISVLILSAATAVLGGLGLLIADATVLGTYDASLLESLTPYAFLGASLLLLTLGVRAHTHPRQGGLVLLGLAGMLSIGSVVAGFDTTLTIGYPLVLATGGTASLVRARLTPRSTR